MRYTADVVITPETSYSDIIVPTADTVRMSFLMDMLLSNKKPVCIVQFDADAATFILWCLCMLYAVGMLYVKRMNEWLKNQKQVEHNLKDNI